MKLRGRLAGIAACGVLAAAPVVVPAPAQAACETVQAVAFGAAEPTPCPPGDQLGPTSDDDGGSDTAKATGLAIAAAVLIVGGFVLRYRANRG